MSLKYVVFTTDKYPPFRVDISILFQNELTRLGHVIDWVMQTKEHNSLSSVDWCGGTAFLAGVRQNGRIIQKVVKQFLIAFNDIRFFFSKRRNYDFILVKDKFSYILLCLLYFFYRKKPLFFWLSYPFPESYFEYAKNSSNVFRVVALFKGILAYVFFYKIIANYADHIFLQSEQMLKDVVGRGVDPTKLSVVPMGIDAANIPALKPQIAKRPSILYSGIFYKIRRVDFLLRVFRRVKDVIPEATMYMVGKAENQRVHDELISEAKRLGVVDSVVFTGFVSLDEMYKYISNATVCVSAYKPCFLLNSTSPTKVLEYMALGKPTVSNIHPESTHLLNESGGGVSVPYDEVHFAEAICKLLQHPDKAYDMGVSAQNFVFHNRAYDLIATKLHNQMMHLCGKVS